MIRQGRGSQGHVSSHLADHVLRSAQCHVQRDVGGMVEVGCLADNLLDALWRIHPCSRS